MATSLSTAQRRLNAAKERARRSALGPPLDQSAAVLDAKAEVGPNDMPETVAFVRSVAPRGVAMLEAGS